MLWIVLVVICVFEGCLWMLLLMDGYFIGMGVLKDNVFGKGKRVGIF